MLEQRRSERARLDGLIRAIQERLKVMKDEPGAGSSRVRVRLRVELNKLCVARHEVHQRIIAEETEVEFERIFQEIAGAPMPDRLKKKPVSEFKHEYRPARTGVIKQ